MAQRKLACENLDVVLRQFNAKRMVTGHHFNSRVIFNCDQKYISTNTVNHNGRWPQLKQDLFSSSYPHYAQWKNKTDQNLGYKMSYVQISVERITAEETVTEYYPTAD